jgi:hypothetical protein
MHRRRRLALAAAALLAACGGATVSPSPGTTPPPPPPPPPPPAAVSGIALPTEVSALPTSTASATAMAGLARVVAAAVAPAGSDYALAQPRRWVNEHALDQFSILNTIFSAVGQTHYADPENVGAAPYGATVSWTENGEKQAVLWVTESTMAKEGGADVNAVALWMNMVMGDGNLHVIRAALRIYQAPVQNADGSYQSYGVWKLEAWTGPSLPPAWYFAAEASHGAAGESVVAVHQLEQGQELVGILHKSDASGYGKVRFPDWEQCQNGGGPSCTPSPVTVAYAYDAGTVAISRNGGPAVVKDRVHPVVLVNRYKLFDAATGDDVARHHTFGFPFSWTDGQGGSRWGNYGAWQGRHQIWANGQQLPEGTEVVRADVPAAGAPRYTASRPFTGILVRRTLVPASLADLQGAVLGTWTNRQVNLTWNGTAWDACLDPAFGGPGPMTCGSTGTYSDAQLGAIFPAPGDRTQNAWISRCGMMGPMQGPPPQLVYDPAGGSGPGLYTAVQGQDGRWTSTGTKLAPAASDQVCGGVNGQIWITWDGAAWWKKAVASVDPQTSQPVFGAPDVAYAFEVGREYYLNAQGVSYVARTADGQSYTVKIERQTVARPDNAATFAPAGTLFRSWRDAQSRLELDVDPASPTFLKLRYAVVGTQDAQAGLQVGDVVTTGLWGLTAQLAGLDQPDQYNWEYPSQPNEPWATQQFLVDAAGNFVYLDDAIRLSPVTLVDHAGLAKQYALQFDGNWVGGLPEIWNQLQASGWQMTPQLAGQVVVIPDGTEVTDGSATYLFKAMELQEHLPVLPGATSLPLGAADAIDLAAAPAFDPTWANVRAQPTVPLKYAEGKPVN